MTEKLKLFEELKKDRKILRQEIKRQLCKQIAACAEGGHFPHISDVVEAALSATSKIIDEFPGKKPEFWSIVMQEQEPDMFCDKTMAFLESTYKEDTDGGEPDEGA